MTKAWSNRVWQLGVVSSLTIGSAVALSEYVFAQIQPDSTLGGESSVVNPVDENSDRIDGGAIRDTNLFHSFQEFNVGEGKAVNFANPQGIENIFSRVTGNNPSQIQGVLGVLGDANLFLLNPNGIVFGENASLNVNGSFVATTANAVQFGSQGIFSATSPETPSLLTVNPSALLFNQINQNAAIANNSRVPAGKDPGGIDVFGLRVPNGKSLSLVGGNISMDGGWAIASGGRIELGGLTEAGSIGIDNNGNQFSLSFPEGVQRGDISLTNKAIVGVIADGGGSIAANARNLEILAASEFFAGIGEGLGTANAQAGDITIDATGQIELAGTDSLIFNSVQSQAVGNAGNINIKTGSLSVSDGAQINSYTRGKGNAGSITIQVKGAVNFDGVGSNGFPSAAFSDVQAGAIGDGGNINITTASLSLTNGGELGISVREASDRLLGGQGKGGTTNISVGDTLTISGTGSQIFGSLGAGAVGRGGDININAGSLSVTDGGLISSSTFGKGDSGNISITADNAISLDLADIVNNVQSREAEGNAGKINITTGSFSATNGSQINSFTRGQGNAGDITIQATDAVSFDGVDSDGNYSSLSSSVEAGADGNGGNINITARSLSLTNGGQLEAIVSGETNNLPGGNGQGGNININIDDTLTITGRNISSISTALLAGGAGNGGKIDIQAGSLVVQDDGQITSFTRGQGDAGDITIQATDTVTFDNGLIATGVDAGAGGDAGNVNITAKSLFLTNGGQIDSSTSGKGNGGNITIQVRDTILFDGSDSNNILTGAIAGVDAGAIGDGGNISITASSLSLINSGTLEVKVRGETDTLPGGQGKGGTVDLNIRDALTISGSDSQISSSLRSGAVGRGGEIKIQAGNVFLKDGGQIDAFTEGKGDSGNIFIIASNTISLDESIIGNLVIDSETEGNAGKINITTDSLSLTNGSQITSLTRGQGNAGDIIIQAKDAVTLDGFQLFDNGNSIAYTGLFSSVDSGAVGNGGNINVTAGSLSLTNGGQLNASISEASDSLPGGKGQGGSVNISVEDALTIVGASTSGIFASLGAGAVGIGGDIDIQAGNLVVKDGGEISSSTFGQGDSGNISITADNAIFLDTSSYIVNNVQSSEAVGNAGKIDINTGSLSVTNGSQINSFTRGQGNAGDITIQATDTVSFDGVDSDENYSGSSSTVEAGANGDGGNISITADFLSINNGAEISANTESIGNAGNIDITLSNILEANNGEISTSSTQSSGGAIKITAGDIKLRKDSDIRSNIFSGTGGGGNITLTADSVIAFDDSDIFAFAQNGQGGNITLNTPAYFGNSFTTNSFNSNPNLLDNNDRADINATGAISGVVTVPDVSFIQNSLTELPENPIDTNALIANSCIARRERGGTFTITGAGGLPNRPGDASVSPYPIGNVRGVESDRTFNNSTPRPWKIGDPIVEPQAAYRLADGQMVLSRECER